MTRWLLIALAVAATSCGGNRSAPAATTYDAAKAGRAEPSGTRAPSLDGGSAWLNTTEPLSIDKLAGHVVVLDFWTYCCINCLHALPELARIEREFADQPVVVIGVHSGKFDAEKDTERIRAAMGRYDVRHPVVVDSSFEIWQRYGVTSWPTIVIIDPAGHVVYGESGEPARGKLSKMIEQTLDAARASGTLAKERIVIEVPESIDTGPLAYPGKVEVGPRGQIAIADSNHHRIVIVDGDGNQLDVAGSGIEGSADGPFDTSAFRRPQGMAFSSDGNTLYVADTGNHQIRALDLRARTVSTLAGTGNKGTSRHGGDALAVALRSPWDVAVDGDQLYVAMAGSHQIWRYDPTGPTIEPFAGTGRESIDDGALDVASFSQPSALSLRDGVLYVADSETSAVRAIDLEAGQVRTIVGVGLFDFGDVDGTGKAVRLQHALGVVATRDGLYVADTYNDKIKRIDPSTAAATTIGGGDGALSEPGGLDVLPDGRLIIADTNHHRLRTLDVRTGTFGELVLTGVTAPAGTGLVLADPSAWPVEDAARTPIAAAGRFGVGSNTLSITPVAPAGAKIADGSPLVVEIRGAAGIEAPARTRIEMAAGAVPLRIPVQVSAGSSGPIQVDLSFYWCTSGDSTACVPERARLDVTVDLSGPAPGDASVVHQARKR